MFLILLMNPDSGWAQLTGLRGHDPILVLSLQTTER